MVAMFGYALIVYFGIAQGLLLKILMNLGALINNNIKYNVLVVAFFLLVSCKKSVDKDALPSLMELVIVDSLIVKENNFFMNGQFHVQIIGDSLIGVSSVKKPSVGFYNIKGEQRKRIASGDYPIGSFLPSYFDGSEYPIVYILDMRSKAILVFDVENQKLVEKIKIELPNHKEIKIMGSKFKKLKNGFLIELASADYEALNPLYYKESGNLFL